MDSQYRGRDPYRFQSAYGAADRYALDRSFASTPAGAYQSPGSTTRYPNVSSTISYPNYGPSPSYPSAPHRSGIVAGHTSSLPPAVGNMMNNPYTAGFGFAPPLGAPNMPGGPLGARWNDQPIISAPPAPGDGHYCRCQPMLDTIPHRQTPRACCSTHPASCLEPEYTPAAYEVAKLGFIGVGTISSAIVRGLCTSSAPPSKIYLSHRNAEKAAKLQASTTFAMYFPHFSCGILLVN